MTLIYVSFIYLNKVLCCCVLLSYLNHVDLSLSVTFEIIFVLVVLILQIFCLFSLSLLRRLIYPSLLGIYLIGMVLSFDVFHSSNVENPIDFEVVLQLFDVFLGEY